MLPLEWEGSHRQDINECMWLCFDKTLFVKPNGVLDRMFFLLEREVGVDEYRLKLSKIQILSLPDYRNNIAHGRCLEKKKCTEGNKPKQQFLFYNLGEGDLSSSGSVVFLLPCHWTLDSF